MSRFKINQSYGGRKQAHEVACDKIAKCEKSYFQPQANQALADMLWTMMNIHNYLNSLINNYVADRQISLYILQKSSCYTHNSVANVSHEIHNSVANKVHTLQCEYMWPCHPFSAPTLLVGWQEGHLGCTNPTPAIPERICIGPTQVMASVFDGLKTSSPKGNPQRSFFEIPTLARAKATTVYRYRPANKCQRPQLYIFRTTVWGSNCLFYSSKLLTYVPFTSITFTGHF